MVDSLAVGSNAAGSLARVLAMRPDAGSGGGAVGVGEALGPAAGVGVPAQPRLALARRAGAAGAAYSARSARRGIARVIRWWNLCKVIIK